MTQANPFDAMGQSFNALQGAWDQRTRNRAGQAFAAGDLGTATNALASGGMVQEATALRSQARADEQRERGTQIVGALRGKDFAGARQIAQSPEELAAIETFASNATKAERDAAAANAGNMAAIATAVGRLPREQQRAAVLQYATQFGVDPSKIPEQITPEWIEGVRVQALGLEEYLKFQDRETDNRRPIQGPFGIIWPEGTTSAQMGAGQPRSLGSALDDDWEPVRPKQPPAASAAVGGERSQTPRVSFQSSNEARQSVSRIVPGVRVTNGDRTPDDTARIRAQGYKPSDTSFHLSGRALDLVPPQGMSMAELEQKMRREGFRVLNEGHHIHVSW